MNTYFDGQSDFQQYGNLEADGKLLDDLIIIPESQNFLQYAEERRLFYVAVTRAKHHSYILYDVETKKGKKSFR